MPRSDAKGRPCWRLLIAAVALVAMLVTVGAAAAADNVFVGTGDLSDGRSSHAMVRLLDGRVLVAGGWGPIGGGYITIKSSSELYDPASGAWTSSGDMTVPRANAVYSMLADGRVVVAGGESLSPQGGTELTRSVEIYNPASGTFAAAGELPFQPRFAQALANGRVLMLASSGAAVFYDPETGSSTETGSALRDHQGGTMTLLADGRVLVAGGVNAADLAEVYDPGSGAFGRVGNMALDRSRHSATLLADGSVLIVGGEGGYLVNGFYQALASVEVFDPATGAFATRTALPQPRVMHDATRLADGTILLTGGIFYSGSGPRSDAELYDPATGSSIGPIQMRAERVAGTALALADGSVLVAAGPSPRQLNASSSTTKTRPHQRSPCPTTSPRSRTNRQGPRSRTRRAPSTTQTKTRRSTAHRSPEAYSRPERAPSAARQPTPQKTPLTRAS